MDMGSDDEKVEVRIGHRAVVARGEARAKTLTLPDGRTMRAEEVNEHMRVELLDPKYQEQRQKFLERQKDSNLASSKDVARQLSRLAAHRPDVFGVDEETARKARDEAKRKREQQSLVWDGGVGSVAEIKAASLLAQSEARAAAPVPQPDQPLGIGPAAPRPVPQMPAAPHMMPAYGGYPAAQAFPAYGAFHAQQHPHAGVMLQPPPPFLPPPPPKLPPAPPPLPPPPSSAAEPLPKKPKA
jgi:splicing factor 3A subunit 1